MKKFVANGNGFDWVEKKSFQARKDAWSANKKTKNNQTDKIIHFSKGYIDVTLEPDGTYSYYISVEDDFAPPYSEEGSMGNSNQSGYQLLKDLHKQNIPSDELEKIRREIQKME